MVSRILIIPIIFTVKNLTMVTRTPQERAKHKGRSKSNECFSIVYRVSWWILHMPLAARLLVAMVGHIWSIHLWVAKACSFVWDFLMNPNFLLVHFASISPLPGLTSAGTLPRAPSAPAVDSRCVNLFLHEGFGLRDLRPPCLYIILFFFFFLTWRLENNSYMASGRFNISLQWRCAAKWDLLACFSFLAPLTHSTPQ